MYLTCAATFHNRHRPSNSIYPSSQCSCVASSNPHNNLLWSPRTIRTHAAVCTSPIVAWNFKASITRLLGSQNTTLGEWFTVKRPDVWSSRVTGCTSSLVSGEFWLGNCSGGGDRLWISWRILKASCGSVQSCCSCNCGGRKFDRISIPINKCNFYCNCCAR